MRVLLTGACGYVARTLMPQLEENHELVLLDQVRPEDATMFNPDGTGRVAAPFETKWPFVQATLQDVDKIRDTVQGCDAIIHLAAVVTGHLDQAVETFQGNAPGTFVVLDAARRAGVQRFLCASSINAYGTFYWRVSGKLVPYTKMPLDESFEPVPEDAYSLSKWFNELTCAMFTRAHGITTAAFRFAGVWNDTLYDERMKEGLKPTTEWSDLLYQWVHVRDLTRGIRQALDEPNLPEHGVYNLGAADTLCPEPTMEILEKFRPDLAATVEKPLVGRAPLLSIDRARAAFGYDPQYRMGA